MSVIRSFIAIDLSDDIRQRLDQVATELKEKLASIPVRWVPVSNIHLTLMFLGDVSVANLELLKEALQAELEGFSQFEFSVGQIGAFPSTHRPRVIWIGIEAPVELKSIQACIENRMRHLGYLRQDRPFSPHLTLGRISRGSISSEIRIISQVLQTSRIGFLGVNCVQEICLYKSDLLPSGAVYTKLMAVKLMEKSSQA